MKFWVFADSHFGHAGIVDWGHRPKNHETKMFWALSRIPESDTLIHLGDVCLGSDADNHEKWVKPIACRKWLVRGNHDKKSYAWYLNHGWDHVCEYLCLRIYGKRILFVHDPQIGTKFNEVLPARRKNDLIIHGHWHNIERVPSTPLVGNLVLFAPEAENYQPATLERLVERHDKGINERVEK